MILRSFFLDLLRLGAVLLITLIMVVLISQGARYLETILDSPSPLKTLLHILLLLPPTFLPLVLPLTLGLAITFFYFHKTQDNELLILRALGYRAWTIALPGLWLATLGLMIGYLLSFYATPRSFQEIRALKHQAIQFLTPSILQKGTFTSLIPQFTLYFQDYGPNGSLQGFILNDRRLSPEKDIVFIAESATLLFEETEIHIFLVNGVRQEFEPNAFSELSFETYSFPLNLTQSAFSPHPQRPQEYTFSQLLAAPELTLELHRRLIQPWGSILLSLIPLVCFLSGSMSLRKRLWLSLTSLFAIQAISFSLLVWSSVSWLYAFHGGTLLLFGVLLTTEIFPYRETRL